MQSLRGRHPAGCALDPVGRWPGARRAALALPTDDRARPKHAAVNRLRKHIRNRHVAVAANHSQWMDRLPQILPALFLQASIRICRLCIRRDVSRSLPEVPLRRELAGRICRRTISPDDPRRRLIVSAIVTSSAIRRFPRTRGPRSRERSRCASPPVGLRSLTQTWRALAPTFPHFGVRVMFGSCPPTSYPPTPTWSSASRVDAARERAPIASPGSPPNTARRFR